MNLITFNEHFAVMSAHEGREVFEKACVAPLFEYTAIRTHVDDVRKKLLDNDGWMEDDGVGNYYFELPYEIMRAEFKLKNRASDPRPVCRYQVMIIGQTTRLYFRTPEIREMKRNLFCLEIGNHGMFEVWYWMEKNKRWTLYTKMSAATAPSESPSYQVYRQLLGAVTAFSVDAMSPNTHTATVEPNEVGRSVEWRKARTHYVLISHGHPANKASVKPGERIGGDTSGELVRMAHNRRAHKRTLTHPRYRFKRGSRIRVRACWVGPKEWQDEGGKQIYRILEPSDWKPGDPVRIS